MKEKLVQKRKRLSKQGLWYSFGGGSLCFLSVVLGRLTDISPILVAVLGLIGVLSVIKAGFILFDYERVRKQIKEL